MSLEEIPFWLGTTVLCVGVWGLMTAGGGTAWYWRKHRVQMKRPDDDIDTLVNGCVLSGLSAAIAAAGALVLKQTLMG